MLERKIYSAPTPDNLSWPTSISIDECWLDDKAIMVRWSAATAGKQVSRFHPLWLRDNCACERCLHTITREHLIDVADLPIDICAENIDLDDEGSLEIKWQNDGHQSIYNPGWLYAHCGLSKQRVPKTSLWNAEAYSEPISFDAVEQEVSDELLHQVLLSVEQYGLARIRKLGSSSDTIEAIGLRIGPIRETHFERIFQVVSRADSDSNAYTSEALSAHTDIPTRETPPGIQLLHCLVSDADGGESTMTDGFKLAADLAEFYPKEFETLTSVNWCFANRAGDTDYRWDAPVISLDALGKVNEVRLLPFSRAPLQTSYNNIEPSYRALKLFITLANSDQYQMRYKLSAGDMVIFDNRRILHGRAEFYPHTGDRELRGLYLDRDDVHSTIRRYINQQNQA